MDKKLYELRRFADLLEQGIDPITHIKFKEETILGNDVIRNYNHEIKGILDSLIKLEEARNGGNKRNNKLPFYLSDEVKTKIVISDIPISISTFCYSLNGYIYSGMKKLRASQITKWLMEEGYLLCENWRDDKYIKKPTPKGNELGISSEIKENKYGEKYEVNLYNCSAQKFIVEHLEEIVFGKNIG